MVLSKVVFGGQAERKSEFNHRIFRRRPSSLSLPGSEALGIVVDSNVDAYRSMGDDAPLARTWIKVVTSNGQTGFVSLADLITPKQLPGQKESLRKVSLFKSRRSKLLRKPAVVMSPQASTLMGSPVKEKGWLVPASQISSHPNSSFGKKATSCISSRSSIRLKHCCMCNRKAAIPLNSGVTAMSCFRLTNPARALS